MELPYLTSGLLGTGGMLRREPEDFRVDEIPLYEPSGEGDHVFFRMWKRGIDTFEAIRRISRALDAHERDFSVAGLKDARAVTTQWISTEVATEDQVRALQIPCVAILEVARHGNKLRLGHLRGNRFVIRVREAETDAEKRAEAILDVLVRRGAPNFFGAQRFGARMSSHICGEAILRRDYEGFIRHLIGGPSERERDPYLKEARRLFDEGKLDEAYEKMPIRQRAEKKALHALIRFRDPERAFFAIPKRMRQMFLSSFQSHLFNQVLERRLESIDRMEVGDLAFLHRNRAVFRVLEDELEAARRRCDAYEISPSGPIYGTKIDLAEGEPGRVEREVLAGAGISQGDFRVGGGLSARGRRRSLRIALRDLDLRMREPTDYEMEFSLPSGCYATCVMREVMKGGRGEGRR